MAMVNGMTIRVARVLAMHRTLLNLLLTLALVGGSFGTANAVEAVKSSQPGDKMPEFSLGDYQGKVWPAPELHGEKGTIVVFIGTECPLMLQYASTLESLHKKYSDKGLKLVAVASNQQDSLTELSAFARQHKLTFPILKDPGNKVADEFKAERTPEVFLLNASRTLVYRGRIDDQYTYGRARPEVKENYLVNAIEAMLVGQPPKVGTTDVVGCHIGRVLRGTGDQSVTYSKQISRILQDKCVNCHRPGEIGPFALTSYSETVGWAAMIDEVVSENRMPPWHANPKHGSFRNDTRLSDAEKSQIHQWVEAGAPEGDPADLPPPKQYETGWQIGKPDLVIEMATKPYAVPAKGEVKYQYFIVDPKFTEDKWISAAECRPGNRAVVHHIIVGLVLGDGSRLSGGQHSEWLTATAPGARPLMLPEGLAKKIPAGAKLVFQMHYTPNGTATEDLSSVGLKFADPKTVRKEVATDKAATRRLQIPPHDDNYHTVAEQTIARDIQMLAMFPHMHLRGKAFRYTARYPDGEEEILLDVPNYDFAWQNSYEFTEPKLLPKGTKLVCDAWYNNSESNLANPDPSATVGWGDQTWEEMMIGYYDAVWADQDLLQENGRAEGARTSLFIARTLAGETKLPAELLIACESALDQPEALQALGAELRKVLPQLDRVCVTSVDGKKVVVKHCVQDPLYEGAVGGVGKGIDAAWSKLGSLIEAKKPTVYSSLVDESGFDLKHMAKAYRSSVHVPVKIGETPSTINFWSAESDAFPEEAVALIEKIAAALAK
ncbi:alkyl hydroperoxide reductase/ Thiol specific antioxidant/ Mal allergen [Pirellula staleyi DSM 6068]|uniref:Alkyl hydroperoxide reductase/ Thiol specific antioxidant/ Mal allergen n=1 Tax=Pirellula staleyi (strain ATCC 27377 / DSM 6068 / ICPB 4128) TaxID=530564 RepID=D2R8I6_PIRSD|nr:redoxin domain-containing protein [Pirellula staleyi]ADB17527.1 alkyl hydroperoxide reductase/ Thiol specific antioxidant/ Mal allergen [Pirellula staleyi DSM 6068]